MNYLYNGVKLPEPPLGFSGNVLIFYNSEEEMYYLAHGTLYAYPAGEVIWIVCVKNNEPTIYRTYEGRKYWDEIVTGSSGDKYGLICFLSECVWTNKDIYKIDIETAKPTATVVYEGTAARVVPDDPEPERIKDSRSVSMMMGYMVGQAIRK